MAASLEELLTKEGFRGGRSRTRSRPSFKAEAATASALRYPFGGPSKTDSPAGPSSRQVKTQRTKSDVTRYIRESESPRISDGTSRRPRDDPVGREKTNARSKTSEHSRFAPKNGPEDNALNIDPLEDINDIEIVRFGVEGDETVKDVYSDQAYLSGRSEKTSKLNGSEERYRERKWKDKQEPERHNDISNKKSINHTGFSNDNRKKLSHPVTTCETSRDSKNIRSFENVRRPKSKNAEPAVLEVALDEVAVRAMISILNGYIKRFFKDAEFRAMLHHNCSSLLDFIESEESDSIECNAKFNFEEAVAIVEKAAEETANAKDLKTASLQLSMITGLNINDLIDGDAPESSNSRLLACAHIYLSVIYKLQKKDTVSAKHLLQVFCDSPRLARTLLLPELWDYLFYPQLSHLKVWYSQEKDFLLNTPGKITKLKVLEKVYSEILDSGTSQFAVYYKDWLTEGVEAPSLPSVHIPFMSRRGSQHHSSGSHSPAAWQGRSQDHSSGSPSPAGPFSPRPIVSKKLYESVFGSSGKPRVYEDENNGEINNIDNAETFDSSPFVVKPTLTYSNEKVKYDLEQAIENQSSNNAHDNTFLLADHGNSTPFEEEWKLVKLRVSQETDPHDQTTKSCRWQETVGDTQMLDSSAHTKENELALKTLAKSVFELELNKHSGVLTVSALSRSNKLINANASNEGLNESYEYFDEGSIRPSIPQDFICPLTSQLFEYPVTLETGQTFEREAIRNWFNQGNRTCPLTGKSLECPTVPLTNFILKRVVDSWKLEHFNNLSAFASQVFSDYGGYKSIKRNEATIFVLEKLLTSFGRADRLTNAKHLISLGGLDFLMVRFEYGDLEEKTRVAGLMSCFIEADSSCRSHICRKIDKKCIFELLHSKQSESRRNGVFLLTELVCLSRRRDVTLFLSGLPSEEIANTMHILLEYLQSSSSEQKPLVAVLILHLDLLVEPLKYSIYREEAIDAIAAGLESSLTNEKVREMSCRALMILGHPFCDSGSLSIENWILEQAGYNNNFEVNSIEENLLLDDPISLEDEEEESREELLKNLSVSLLGSGTGSFLESISKGSSSGMLDLVRICLTTIAWLSCALSSLLDTEFQHSSFPALISGLKENLENGEQIELQILASMSLLNLSKNPECRSLLMTIAEEILVPLRSLTEVTWTAKELYAIISGEDL